MFYVNTPFVKLFLSLMEHWVCCCWQSGKHQHLIHSLPLPELVLRASSNFPSPSPFAPPSSSLHSELPSSLCAPEATFHSLASAQIINRKEMTPPQRDLESLAHLGYSTVPYKSLELFKTEEIPRWQEAWLTSFYGQTCTGCNDWPFTFKAGLLVPSIKRERKNEREKRERERNISSLHNYH